MNEVVDKYGVVWVAAGGNHGPALFTIGTPPSISTNNIIGIKLSRLPFNYLFRINSL